MTLSAWSSHVLLLPTEDDGISRPSSRMPATSTSAMSSLPRNPNQTNWATWLEVDVEVLHLAGVDTLAADVVGLVRQSQLDAVHDSPARRPARARWRRPSTRRS